MTHREQGSGNLVYVKREKSQFKPRWHLSAGFRELLSLQIIFSSTQLTLTALETGSGKL